MPITLASEPFRRTYYSTLCSTTTLFCILIYLCVFIIPFILSNYQKNIWRGNFEVVDSDSELKFTGNLYFLGGPDPSHQVSTFKTLKLPGASAAGPSYDLSYNSMKTPSDDIVINLKVYHQTPLTSSVSEFIYLFMKYTSNTIKGLQFTDLIRIPVTFTPTANSVTIYGTIFLEQSDLYNAEKASSYSFDSTATFISSSYNIFKTFNERSKKTFKLAVRSQSFSRRVALEGFYEANIILNRENLPVRAYPTISSVLRNSWPTYLAFFIPIAMFFRLILRESLKYRLFSSTSSIKVGDDEIYRVF